MHNNTQQSTKALKLTKQAAGTLQKVLKMIENNDYCPEIIQQLDSVCGLLSSSRKELLVGHLEHCVTSNFSKDPSKTVAELTKLYKLS
jgi:CsoR family transcriptional regulator, copper-sensing transcriptional repressor